MVIGIIGESCTGKSSLATMLKDRLDVKVFSGKDYLRLAKNEQIAKKLFEQQLAEAMSGANLVYVIAEREHLELLPRRAVRVLMTADMDLILERFASRMHGTLPPPVKTMLERKHGIFDGEPADFHIHNSMDTDKVSRLIVDRIKGENVSCSD